MAELLGPHQIEQAAEALRQGRLVAFPTETVYGLGADVASAAAVNRIFEAKGRPKGHPLIAHVASIDGLVGWLVANPDGLGDLALRLAEAFWPGPLTLIVARGEAVCPEATGGRDTVGVRMPDHPVALALLEAFGGGVAGPSANRFGAVSPTTASHVLDDLGPAIDVVLDGGPCRVGLESTIVDVTGPSPVLLRPGGVPVAALEAVSGVPVTDGRSGPSRASGMLASHYAPAATVEVVEAADPAALAEAVSGAEANGDRVGLIAPFVSDHRPAWHLPADSEGFGAELYRSLREADEAGLTRLLVVPPTKGDTLDAVLDRLAKAAAPR